MCKSKKKQEHLQIHSVEVCVLGGGHPNLSNQAICCQLQLLLYQVAPLISDVSPGAEGVETDMLPAAYKQASELHLVVITRKRKVPQTSVERDARKVTCC